jgi:beta-mannosidase
MQHDTRMNLRAGRRAAGRARVLAEGWQLCATAPGAIADPLADAAAVAALAWTPIAGALPAAAALRASGAWSLDGAARRFDAEDWWYRLRFDAPDHAAGTAALLGFDGLATLAEVWLNGRPILRSDNMFLAHAVEAGALLRASGNELLLCCRSLDQALAARRPRPRWRAPMVDNQQLRWLRTTLLGRTPGWSPPAAVAGPWRDVWLDEQPGAAPDDWRLHATVEQGAGVLALSAAWALPADAGLSLVVERSGRNWVAPVHVQADGRLAARLVVPDADLWWPHTHGEPALYAARLEGGPWPDGRLDLGAVGFRRIEADLAGGRFALRVNGVPVFCRGACWTPPDPVALRASPDAYAQAVAQVRAAGFNMLRVGGTMVYEDDAFLDACDAQGVLVWQEFMFASLDYPADDAFTAGVKLEAAQQLQRLQGRPSLAVLCGNSEVEQQAAMWGASRELWQPALFHRDLAEAAANWRPDVPYWPSSAHGGAFPHQGDAGTTSYYGVGAYQRPLEDARRAAVSFATECLAFANLPEPSAMARMPGGLGLRVHHPGWKARTPRDLGAGWDFEDVRDHYVQRLFGVDPARLRYADHDRYLLLGRLASGEAMSAAFGEWRRAQSTCGGAMVWFLRDLWAGAGWGVLDERGDPKAAFHALRRALQPQAVWLTDEGGNGYCLHAINEGPQAAEGELEIVAYGLGDAVVAQASRALQLDARGSLTLPLLACFDSFADFSDAYRFGPAVARAVAVTWKRGDAVVSRAFAFPGGLDVHTRTDLGIQAAARMQEDGRAVLGLQSQRLALAVHVEADGWVAEDAYFHLPPGAAHEIVLRPLDAAKPKPLRGHVLALNAAAPASIKMQP